MDHTPRHQSTRFGVQILLQRNEQIRMKRYTGLWEEIVNFESLYSAYEDARKGRRFKPEIMVSSARIEEIIYQLIFDLNTGEWRSQPYYDFESRAETKRRIINAPTFRDRILHHAIVTVVRPLFEKKFIHDSYASRRGKGTHKACKRLKHFLLSAAANGEAVYVLQCDIHHYYQSIDHDVLKKLIRQTIADRRLLEVWDRIIDGYNGDTGKGIPIGALTSQLSANIYLNILDHFVKECMQVKRYLRYMDDFVIVANDKETLSGYLADIKWLLECHLKLKLNPKTKIFPASRGVDFAGFRTFMDRTLPRKRNIKAAKKRFKELSWKYRHHQVNLEDVKPRVASFLGYVKHCRARKSTISTLKWLKRQRGEKKNGNKAGFNHHHHGK
jgi:retron-type reverse transcriptase